MRAIATSLLLVALALAGCTGGNNSLDEVYTCKVTGRHVDLSLVNGSAAKGFDRESACPKPVQPHIDFMPPASGMAYTPVTFTWSVSSGNYTGGHTMLSSIRMSHHPIAVANLTKPDDYGIELAKIAHQDLPTVASGKYAGFVTPGVVYLRAYATIQSTDLGAQDHWSAEYNFTIKPVVATGNVTTVTHQVGPVGSVGGQTVGQLSPSGPLTFKLGDAVAFQNSDVKEHIFTFTSGPMKPAQITVAKDATSAPTVFTVPGTYRISTDDVAAQILEVDVLAPA